MKVWNSICESLIHTDGQNQAALAASTKKKIVLKDFKNVCTDWYIKTKVTPDTKIIFQILLHVIKKIIVQFIFSMPL